MSDVDNVISLGVGQITAIAATLVGGIGCLWAFILNQAKAVEKSNTQQISLLRAHIQSLELSRQQDRKELQELSVRAQTLESRSFSFLETMSARQAMITERMTGLAQHTVNVLDEIVDTMRENRKTDTQEHISMKEELSKARSKVKHLSGEYTVEG